MLNLMSIFIFSAAVVAPMLFVTFRQPLVKEA